MFACFPSSLVVAIRVKYIDAMRYRDCCWHPALGRRSVWRLLYFADEEEAPLVLQIRLPLSPKRVFTLCSDLLTLQDVGNVWLLYYISFPDYCNCYEVTRDERLRRSYLQRRVCVNVCVRCLCASHPSFQDCSLSGSVGLLLRRFLLTEPL